MSASSTHSAGYAPVGANNGDRKGGAWGAGGGGGWNDATANVIDGERSGVAAAFACCNSARRCSTLAPQPTDVNRGNDVLEQIFGSKDVSRAVAQNAASSSGLDPSLLKKMLPMLVAGYMTTQPGGADAAQPSSAQAGGLGGLLGGLLGGTPAGGAPAQAATPGLASMLDMIGDGNALDDILRMAVKFMH
ncbi:MAG: hypothetical protein Q8M01_01605 [Rubrivivax sp.]|nr:hypothetical protein [Rubrivivax sp.]